MVVVFMHNFILLYLLQSTLRSAFVGEHDSLFWSKARKGMDVYDKWQLELDDMVKCACMHNMNYLAYSATHPNKSFMK